MFIGSNGSGKSTILEGIGLLSAAMTDRVDAASLQRKGIRLSVPALYKSNFKSINRLKSTVDLSLEWDDGSSSDVYQYDVHLTTPTDTEYWKYHSEAFFQNGERLWGRSNASSRQSSNYIGFFLFNDAINLNASRKIAEDFSAYGIFQPNTMTLRGTMPDTTQTPPIGLNGGRLAEAIKALIHSEDDEVFFGSLCMDDILDMIDWAAAITVAAPKKSNINANVPTTRDVIEFTDRYMKDTAQLLNPRLAKKMMEVFCDQILRQDKHVFLTTHNPLVLDGLNLSNDNIRLFAVDHDSNGYAQIQRVRVSQKLINEGQPLSRLWIF